MRIEILKTKENKVYLSVVASTPTGHNAEDVLLFKEVTESEIETLMAQINYYPEHNEPPFNVLTEKYGHGFKTTITEKYIKL